MKNMVCSFVQLCLALSSIVYWLNSCLLNPGFATVLVRIDFSLSFFYGGGMVGIHITIYHGWDLSHYSQISGFKFLSESSKKYLRCILQISISIIL